MGRWSLSTLHWLAKCLNPNPSQSTGVAFNMQNGITQALWLVQMRFMSIPRIRAKPDRALDEVPERDKVLRPFFRIMDMIMREDAHAIKVRHLEKKRWDLAIKNKKLNVRAFMKRYPNIFVVYTNPKDTQPWCRLTQEAMDLVEEEWQICRDTELRVLQTLRRMLMMAAGHRIRADKLESVRRILGFPNDFLDRLVPEYPQFFKPVCEGPHVFIELVEWDEGLAVSEFEKRAKQNAIKKGLGDIEVRGKPFPFKISLSPGMALRKKNLEVLSNWQQLPYISPYEDWSMVQKGTPLSEKRLVALLHEFLCLTIEKKARMKVIQPFREEFGLPQKVVHLFERFPGIFYTSHRGGVKTIILREGYNQSNLIEDHPLVHMKEKFVEMVYAGPRLRGPRSPEEGVVSGGVDDMNEDVDGELIEEAENAEDSDDLENESSGTDECDDDGHEEKSWKLSRKA